LSLHDPGVYALVHVPPDRAQFISQWILLAHYYLWELRWEAQQSIGRCYPNFLQRWSIINLCRRLYCVPNGIPEMRRFAVKKPSPFGYSRAMERKNRKRRNVDNAHGLRRPSLYVNTCQADYYGVRSLHVPVGHAEAMVQVSNDHIL